MFFDSILSVLLHMRIDGGINLQTIRVDIITRAVFLFIFGAPAVQRICFPWKWIFIILLHLPAAVLALNRFLGSHHTTKIFAEIGCQTFFMVYTGICKFQRKCLQRITFRIRDVTGFFHLTQYDVTTSQCILTDFRISGYRIITGRILTHSHQHRCLLYFQIFGFTAEISRRGCLYTDSIIQEVELIKIHCQNLFFRIVTFQFYGNHPFDRFLQQTLHSIACHLFRKQLFCQLLWDRTTSTRTFLQQ